MMPDMQTMSLPAATPFLPLPLGKGTAQVQSRLDSEMLDFLRTTIGIASVSGQEAEFTQFVADWGRSHGLRADLWETEDAAVESAGQKFGRHLPLAGRPTLVLELPGEPDLPSLLFNAHADVVAPGDPSAWRYGPWSGDFIDGTIYGRGACDVKGPLTSALWAMLWLAEQPARRGSVLLELVPGEEDCVGMGTWTSVRRGYDADAVIVLEPTEGLPRCASRGGCRFEIETLGRSVHGTCKWLGRDAIARAMKVVRLLEDLEADLNRDDPDEFFVEYPIARPITVDSIRGGDWQGMVCDRCQIAGYFELLPGDDVAAWQQRFKSEIHRRAGECGLSAKQIHVRFIEQYAGHRLAPTHPLCQAAAGAIAACGGTKSLRWSGFNSGCEAGMRANWQGTPTLVWGPGSLAHAHAANEQIAWADVQVVSKMLASLAERWTRG